MDDNAYFRQMQAFYDSAASPIYSTSAAEHLAMLQGWYDTAGHWLREVAVHIQEEMRGRHVLEVACGHGRWSIFAAEAAECIVATDNSPRLLSLAQRIAALRGLTAPKLTFVETDAFALGKVAGAFDAALVMNFLQHIPIVRRGEFLDGLHRRIGSGARVFLGVNLLSESSRARLYQKPGSEDLWEMRERSDGTTYEIIDNVFQPDDVRRMLGDQAKDLRIEVGKAFWWAVYSVA